MSTDANSLREDLRKNYQEPNLLNDEIFNQLTPEELQQYKEAAIDAKTQGLMSQRRNAMGWLQKNYSNTMLNLDNQRKLKDRNDLLLNVYTNSSVSSRDKLAFMDQKYLDNRRQVEINEYEYSRRKSSVFLLTMMCIALIICIIIGSLTEGKSKQGGILLVTVVFIIYWAIHTWRNSKRSNYDWSSYNWGRKGIKAANNPLMNATGYSDDSLLCKDHPNLCKADNILNDDTLSTRSKLYEMNNLYNDTKQIRKKDYCQLQEIEAYYKDMEKVRSKLYDKRKKELTKEIEKKELKLAKELADFDKQKPSNNITPWDDLKCPKTTIQGA
jgi:hypothetical protein